MKINKFFCHQVSFEQKNQKKSKLSNEKESESLNLFKSAKIFVIDAGLGKTRGDLFRKQLGKHGAEICKDYTDMCSHVVVDESVTPSRICAILDTEKPPDIFSTKVVLSTWVTDCLKQKKTLDVSEYLVDFSSVNKKETKLDNDQCTSTDAREPGLNHPSTSSDNTGHVTSGDKEAAEFESKLPKVGVMWRGTKKVL